MSSFTTHYKRIRCVYRSFYSNQQTGTGKKPIANEYRPFYDDNSYQINRKWEDSKQQKEPTDISR